MGSSCLQSGHQCAQKKSRTGFPRSAASGVGLAPRNSRSSKRGRGLAFEREQVDVLLDARADGRGPVER